MFTPFLIAFLLFAVAFGGGLLMVSWMVRDREGVELGPSVAAGALGLAPHGPHEARGEHDGVPVVVHWVMERRGVGSGSRLVRATRYLALRGASPGLALGDDDALGARVGVSGAPVRLGVSELDGLTPRGDETAWRSSLARSAVRAALMEGARAGRIAAGPEGAALERAGWDDAEEAIRAGLGVASRLATALAREQE